MCNTVRCGTRAFLTLEMEAGRFSESLLGKHTHTYQVHYTASHAGSHCRCNLRPHKAIRDFSNSVLVFSSLWFFMRGASTDSQREHLPSSSLHTRDLLLFPLTNHLSLHPHHFSPILTPIHCFCPFYLFSSSQAKKEKRKIKEISLELVSLFFLSQIFHGLYS